MQTCQQLRMVTFNKFYKWPKFVLHVFSLIKEDSDKVDHSIYITFEFDMI